jgi:hypothetical protein
MEYVAMALDRHWRAVGAAAIAYFCEAGGALGQDMEPRAFSASPIDTNFLIVNYLHTTGSVSIDPSLPITGAKATIDTGSLGYERTFDLFGRSASAAIVVPYHQGELSGQFLGNGTKVSRSGVGDLGLRLTGNLYGNPALPLGEFVKRRPTTTVGIALTVKAPTGDYNPAHLVNIGANRWAVRPELGLAESIGDWFADAAAGIWLFGDNGNFSRGKVRGEAPLFVVQAHGGYNFRPGLWLAADAVYYSGGETSISGIANHDDQRVSRYGVTLSVPLTDEFSAKFAWATWLTARNGGNYDTIGVTLQFRWFDR